MELAQGGEDSKEGNCADMILRDFQRDIRFHEWSVSETSPRGSQTLDSENGQLARTLNFKKLALSVSVAHTRNVGDGIATGCLEASRPK